MIRITRATEASLAECKRGHRTHLADFIHTADVLISILCPVPGSPPGIRHALLYASHCASYVTPGTSISYSRTVIKNSPGV